MVARTVKQISATRGVQVEEDTGDDDNLLLQTSLEEVQAVGDRTGQTLEVQPEVEGAVRDVLDYETHVSEALNHVISLVLGLKNVSLHLDVVVIKDY